ncbi:phosphodiester glycosidase family protein [Candidatus Gottesmanbacteria bacterium]|nr:phosphodiester glycosidase family protein [Candidatus Gottesmanbacteria bacterium]
MFKKLLLMILGVFAIGIGIITYFDLSEKNETKVPFVVSPSPIPSADGSQMVVVNQKSYSVFVQAVGDPSQLILIPNFKDKILSREIIENNGCLYGINGGFYTTKNTPLGLFYTKGVYYEKKLHRSTLTNGYVFFKDRTLHISTSPPASESTDFVFQTGPFFTPSTQLSIVNDEPSRRMLVGIDSRENGYFIAVVSRENVHSGPLLADLPQIAGKLNPTFTQLVNLDGGSASAYYIKYKVQYSELTPIGSFLCGK